MFDGGEGNDFGSSYRKSEKSRVREIGIQLHLFLLLDLLCMICFCRFSLQELF